MLSLDPEILINSNFQDWPRSGDFSHFLSGVIFARVDSHDIRANRKFE